MNHSVRILDKVRLNHDVMQFHLERPPGYRFAAGQAIELAIHGAEKKGPAPFTFTGLNSSPDLELAIKIYPEHRGLTAALSNMSPGDHVMITDPWDSFRNNGPGFFIAGGAGITPFVALLRQFFVDGTIGNSSLMFFNKTARDIFLHEELKYILGQRYVDVLTRPHKNSDGHQIHETLLRKYMKTKQQPFYVCGPPGFVEQIQQLLVSIGATENLVNISL